MCLAELSLTRRLYYHNLSRFCCQRQRRPLSRDSSHTCCGKQSLTGTEVENERLLPREPQNSLRFVIDERHTPLLHCSEDGQHVPRTSRNIRDGKHLHRLGRTIGLVQIPNSTNGKMLPSATSTVVSGTPSCMLLFCCGYFIVFYF